MNTLFSVKEETLQGMILRWIDELIKELKLPFTVHQQLEIKTKIGKKKIPDIVLLNEKNKVILVIELKLPYRSPMDDDVVNQALEYAIFAGSPFFVTWNISRLILWETFTPGTSLLDRTLLIKDVIDIRKIDEKILTDFQFENKIKTFLRDFLLLFNKIINNKLKQPDQLILEKFPPDEILVIYLRNSIDALSILFYPFLFERAIKDGKLLNKIKSWFVEQGWIFTNSEDDYYRVSRQQAYLIILKILFYNILKYKYKLQDINVDGVNTGEEFKKVLQDYFNACIRINPRYNIIFASNFIEELPIPDHAVDELKRIINHLNKYDFSKLGYDIIGRVYEKLLPPTERHKLGQYFTRSDIVDLIIGFTIKDPDAKVLDPACGSGTFLIRAYHRKKYLANLQNINKTHKEIINELYGIDISKFPAMLSTINLLKEDLREIDTVPKIINKDFFDVRTKIKTTPYDLIESLDKSKQNFKIELPEKFDVVVTNPPYTRQEEMEHLLKDEKDKALTVCFEDWKSMSGTKEQISKRSSIYVYFFIHGGVFLKEKGRLGFITSNSWLDVDYGKCLQKFFLQNFKIIAIIESKIERWFSDADINTVITILERCSNEEERNNNLVKFVQLKIPLSQLIPLTNNEEERWRIIDSFVNKIESLTNYYEDDKIRVFIKKQKELWDEGYNPEQREYVGSKWGKYLRAPPILFKILEKGKNILIPLKEIAEVRMGLITGANEFFYLKEEEIRNLNIEREFWMHPVTKEEWLKIKQYIPEKDVWIDKGGEYLKQSQYSKKYQRDEILIDGNVIWIPNYVIKSPRECKSIIVDPKDLKYRVLMIHKDKFELRGTNVSKYIEWGESQGFQERPSCKSRQKWYELPEVSGDLLCMMSINDRHLFWYNEPKCYIDARLYGIKIKKHGFERELASILNSTIFVLFVELLGRLNLGQGALDVKVYEYAQMLVIDPSKLEIEIRKKLIDIFSKISTRKIGSIFEEIGADSPEKVSLDNVKPDRRELDEIVMGKILGLSEEEQLEVYRAVIDLVKSRIERARSISKKKDNEEVNTDKLVDDIIQNLQKTIIKNLKSFPEDYLPKNIDSETLEIPEAKEIKYGSDLVHGFYVRFDNNILKFSSPHEAKFVYYAAINGKKKIRIPKDINIIKDIVQQREIDLKNIKEKIIDYVENLIPDEKIRNEVLIRIFSYLKIPNHLKKK